MFDHNKGCMWPLATMTTATPQRINNFIPEQMHAISGTTYPVHESESIHSLLIIYAGMQYTFFTSSQQDIYLPVFSIISYSMITQVIGGCDGSCTKMITSQ